MKLIKSDIHFSADIEMISNININIGLGQPSSLMCDNAPKDACLRQKKKRLHSMDRNTNMLTLICLNQRIMWFVVRHLQETGHYQLYPC